MSNHESIGALRVDAELKQLIENDILPGTGVSASDFWAALERINAEFSPRNRALLKTRDELQARIDQWHEERKGQPHDAAAYKAFLTEIGYLVEEPADFSITTENVDTEIAAQAGAQLVVPVKNARYALNAANARWGSLYDALYGSDVIAEDGGAERGGGYNPVRGERVIAFARDHLDQSAPLAEGSHAKATASQMLEITDAEVAAADSTAIRAAYRSLRSFAATEIQRALPQVGELIQQQLEGAVPA